MAHLTPPRSASAASRATNEEFWEEIRQWWANPEPPVWSGCQHELPLIVRCDSCRKFIYCGLDCQKKNCGKHRFDCLNDLTPEEHYNRMIEDSKKCRLKKERASAASKKPSSGSSSNQPPQDGTSPY